MQVTPVGLKRDSDEPAVRKRGEKKTEERVTSQQIRLSPRFIIRFFSLLFDDSPWGVRIVA